MALTIWGEVKSADLKILTDGTGVSVAVVQSGQTLQLKWKRENQNGSWPSDAQALTFATLSTLGPPFEIQETSQGVLIGDGVSRFWLARNAAPTNASQFQVVNVL